MSVDAKVISERVARCKAMVAAMCSKRRPPAMSIPADPERDEDLFIDDTLTMCLAAADDAERMRKALVDVMKFAKPSRGAFCSAECLGQCSECKAIVNARAALSPTPPRATPPKCSCRYAPLRGAAWDENCPVHRANPNIMAGEGRPNPFGDRPCWLIERSQPEGQTPPVWFSVSAGTWSIDASKATRYPTRAEAQAELDKRSGVPGVHSPWGHVTEHVFVGGGA